MFALPIAAFALTIILHFLALKVFPAWGLLDFPERYGLSRPKLPYPSGIIVVLVFLILFLLTRMPSPEDIGVALSIALLAALSFIDDRKPIPAKLRIIAQIGVAVLLLGFGVRIDAVTNPLPGVWGTDTSIHLDAGVLLALSGVFTVAWILLTINALNWFDGIPGQVSVLSTIAFLVIGLLSLSNRVQQPALALTAFTLAGIAAGGLLFDFPPPRVLMGDTGAMFFGLMIGVLTIASGGKVATAFLVLGVPLIDVLFVIVRRIARGQSPLQGNRTDQHLHHRLLRRGWSQRQVILLTAALGSAFGITALFLATWEKVAAGVLLLLVMLGLNWYTGREHDKSHH